ncbi:hypothetical protein [Corynebacterium auris]|uniref:hypothetical protein n=1 Tax=Corynebacterium auris TaxID=44750 RepID=UPI0025B4DD25|nr:hypothetical protein [Corynebacterium auris]WJY68082.1 hypothetical protein CAURIS_05900 [Corynebacterium auris]
MMATLRRALAFLAFWGGYALLCIMLTTKTTRSYDYLWVSALLFALLAVPSAVVYLVERFSSRGSGEN